MKKIFLAILLVMIMAFTCSCASDTSLVAVEEASNNSMFVIVETTPMWTVMYHKDTKVMYAVSCYIHDKGNFTLLVDADGKPLLYEE